jgi:multidrug efflux pump subunit AcrA (membrane-fusion protein)
MSERDELEPQQYERQHWEEDVPLKDVRASILRRFVYFGTALFLVFVCIGSLVTFPDELELPFVLKSNNPEETYRFPYPVYVTGSYVRAGDKVSPGQPLIKITSPEIATLINDYNEAQQKMLSYREHKVYSNDAQKEMILSRSGQNKGLLADIRHQVAVLDSTWNSNKTHLEYEFNEAQKKYQANKNLFASKYISKQEFTEYELKKVAAEDALNTTLQRYHKERNYLVAQLERGAMENTSLSEELNKTTSDNRYDSILLASQFDLAEKRISGIFGNFEIAEGSLVLKAAGPGTVSYMFSGDKEVQSSVILLRITNSASSLYSSIICPPSLIGKIEKNQITYLKVATFPSYEWGSVQGHVENFSLTPDENGNFYLRIAIDDTRKLNKLLQPGMNGSGTIVLQEKTFFEYFSRKVRKVYYQISTRHQ